MVEELFVILALVGAVVASYTDLKSRIIPNKLTFPLIGAGIFGYLAYGIFAGDLSMFLASVKSVAVMFVAGYLFWMIGAWSAGDAKEFLFIAALLPTYPAFLYGAFNPALANYPFIITVFINTFLLIFPFAFFYSLYLSWKKGLFFRFLEPVKDLKKYLEMSFVFAAAITVSTFFVGRILALVALVLLYKIQRKYRLSLSAFLIMAYVFLPGGGLYSQGIFVLTNFAVVLILILAVRVFLNSVGILRNEALVEEVKITDLEEGSIIAEEIYIRGDDVLRDRRGMIEKIKDAAMSGSFEAIFQRQSVVGRGAAGVNGEEIEVLKGYVKNGKLEDQVFLKKNMPFAPVILGGLLVSLVIGDAMLAIKMWLYG
jgi:preflagellin peptidase FlaK